MGITQHFSVRRNGVEGVIRCEGLPFQKPRRHRDVVQEGCREASDALFHLAANMLDSKASIVARCMHLDAVDVCLKFGILSRDSVVRRFYQKQRME